MTHPGTLVRSVLILGAGAVGGVLGAALHAAGWTVRFSARANRAATYQTHGLWVEGTASSTWLPPECFAPPLAHERFDLLLIAVKMPDVQAALQWAATHDDGARTIVTLQNGLDAPDWAVARFGRTRVLASAAVVNATHQTLPSGARVVYMQSDLRQIRLAPMNPAALERAQHTATALATAGIDASAQARAPHLLWHQFLGLEPLATACALRQCTLGALRSHPASLGLLRGLFGETAGLARALNPTFDEARIATRWQAYLDGPEAMLPSLAADVMRCERTEHTELAWLTGKVCTLGQQRGLSMPLHEAAHTALALRPAPVIRSVSELLQMGLGITAQPGLSSVSARSSHLLNPEIHMPDTAASNPLTPHTKSIPQLTVRQMRADDVPAIDALRIQSYGRATWFTLTDAQRVRCDQDAPGARVTIVFEGNTPIATLCQVPVTHRDQAQALLELEPNVSDDDFPALVISRAATAEGYAGLRLNHLLRWYTLEAAAASGIRSILAGHARGTPNLRVMAELGYVFRPAAASSMSQVKVNTEHVMSYLPASAFAATQARLAPLIEHVLTHAHWDGPPLSFIETVRAQ